MVAKKVSATELESVSVLADKAGRISQKAIPGCLIEEAIRVPKAIGDHYAYKSATPLQLAQAMNMTPTSGQFKMLTGAAIGYGLTEGGPNSGEIRITPLGMRIVRPTVEGDDLSAKREAFLQPTVIAAFLRKYDGAPVPRKDIACNVLQTMGVPKTKDVGVLDLMLQGARALGLTVTIKDKEYVNLKGVAVPAEAKVLDEEPLDEEEGNRTDDREDDEESTDQTSDYNVIRMKRVYISHGKNKTLLEPIKKLLGFGELEPVISVERQSVSQPVPDKVMQDMRSCGAAIIHVDQEPVPSGATSDPAVAPNFNVLIEIGAAMALYGRRFILLVKEGTNLPSNLQGLFEVRYNSDKLDAEATIKLLEAIRDIKNHPLPG